VDIVSDSNFKKIQAESCCGIKHVQGVIGPELEEKVGVGSYFHLDSEVTEWESSV
jgi:hypothetical protein